ncbi:Glycine zipper 2TM domain-containing protein [Sphingomonas gellani]|uniref:17 kDa surface antigen n=1 Tax=Sphingomonas gellani TaxID=1166340 RepID=A0A1H8EJN2_9SPHN|nr:glycine zipper 2TM domain-containing protein [Sphingomonas gellani]SEN19699.1 Glycine zipper 2TM domain-containing protein [Sphingomonas gellani]
MLTRLITAGVLAASAIALTAPVTAQTTADQRRFDDAQARFDREYDLYRQEVDRYRAARSSGYRPGAYDDRGGYRQAPDTYAGDDQYDPNYDPSRYYRVGPNYRERALATNDRVYAGQDGRYYCRRSDGTTGLIVGGAAGGILGNVIDGGHSRTVGTLLGGAVGALAGKSIDQNQSEIRCR